VFSRFVSMDLETALLRMYRGFTVRMCVERFLEQM
jgi:hypothetical protein